MLHSLNIKEGERRGQSEMMRKKGVEGDRGPIYMPYIYIFYIYVYAYVYIHIYTPVTLPKVKTNAGTLALAH